MTDIHQRIKQLTATFAPDPSLDLPVQAARDALSVARVELEQAKAVASQAAKDYRPGNDRTALNKAERDAERAHEQVRKRLEDCTKAVAHREAEFQRAALSAFERAKPVLLELTAAMTGLSEALKPLQAFASERDISNTRASAWVPGVRAGAEALAAMARH